MVAAILAVHIIDHFLTALVAEVHIKVRHTNALRVQKALKDQVIPHGVNVRDAHAVGSDAACARATAGPHRNPHAFGIVDIIKYDQIIVGVAHIPDHADLVCKAFSVFGRHLRAIAALQPFKAKFFKVLLIGKAVRCFKIGQLCIAEFKIKIAHFCNFIGVFTGLGHIGKQIIHFLRAFQIKLIGLELHFIGIIDGFTGLDAQQDLLHFGIFFLNVVAVVGGNQRNAGFLAQANQLRQYNRIFLQAVILQLKIVISLPKQIIEPKRRAFGALVVIGQQGLRHLTRQTGRKADQPLVILLQQLFVDAGLGIKALQKARRHQLDQVFVADFVFTQQHQMVVAVDMAHFIKAAARGNIHLAPDDRLDSGRLGRFVKLHAAIHYAVVGNGCRCLPHFFQMIKHTVNAAGTVQQAVFCMHVQMGEILLGIRHFRFSPAGLWLYQ